MIYPKKRATIFRKLIPIVILLGISGSLHAQQDVAPSVTLQHPRNTMRVHLYYLQPDSYQPNVSAQTIHPSVTDTTRAQRIARQIKQVLDAKGLYVDIEDIPADPNYLDTVRNEAVFTPFPLELPTVNLVKVGENWYYSEETARQIGPIYDDLYLFGIDNLPDLFPEWGKQRFLGIALWQLMSLVILILGLYLLHLLLSRLLIPLVHRISRSKIQPSMVDPRLTKKIARILSYIVLFQVARMLLPLLQLPIAWSSFLVVGIRIATALLFMLLFLRIIDVAMLYSRRFAERTTSRLDEQLIPIVKRILQVIVVIAVIVQILRLMEFNVTALIAGVSLGGLAVALAAQDTVKNLLGSAMIFFDKPFQIGDWVEGSGFGGTVIEVGFRTTKIQKIDSSIISVPNGSISNMVVTNLGARVYRLMNTQIGILYNTPPDKIEEFIEGLRQLAIAHPKVREEGYYIYLNDMADSSLNIMFRTQLDVPDYVSELAVKEELYFGILRLGETLGVGFAFPSRSIYIEDPNAPQKVTGPEEIRDFIEKFKARNNG